MIGIVLTPTRPTPPLPAELTHKGIGGPGTMKTSNKIKGMKKDMRNFQNYNYPILLLGH